MDKRSFLKKMTLTSLAGFATFDALANWVSQVEGWPAEEVAKDEDFWAGIRKGYKLKPDYINLENGFYCILPEETLEHYIQHVRDINYQGSYYMRTILWDDKKIMTGKLAGLVGCSAEEMAITRNTTESLDLVIGGMHWQAGDEAVLAEQDYGAMRDMFKLVASRYGVVNKVVSIPINPASDEEIVNLYANAITEKTKLLMVGHMINITGHIMPVRKICDMAHSKGVLVMVDGAHAFAHIQFNLPDLHCDFYGASLHKWLSVPLGAGILYVKKENISKVWPLIADSPNTQEDDILRLNHIGTHPPHTNLAIANAIDYYQMIGPERKEARLRYLQNYWTSKVRPLPNIILYTPVDPKRSCGIANVGIKGMKPADMAKTLLDKYKIFTVAIDGSNVHGCRVTPNLYTTTTELDTFVAALTDMSKV